MQEIILNFPKQFKKGLEIAEEVGIEGKKFSKLVICGMGGSARPGDLLVCYLSDFKIPVYIHRSYNLPSQADKKSLIVAISYSGNTEETISAYEEAVKKGLSIVAITSGGKLKQLAEDNNLPLVVIPSDSIQPRFSSGYLFSALLKVLANSGVIKDKSAEIAELTESLRPALLEQAGQKLAKKLVNKIPLIYTSNRFKVLGRLWKINFNENAKIMAFWNYFPELNHNEMNGYEKSNNDFHLIIPQDKDDHPRILKRMNITADLVKQKGLAVDFIEIKGKNTLEKIFNSLLLSDWLTYYLALEYKVDPVAVKMVEEFKKRLKS